MGEAEARAFLEEEDVKEDQVALMSGEGGKGEQEWEGEEEEELEIE